MVIFTLVINGKGHELLFQCHYLSYVVYRTLCVQKMRKTSFFSQRYFTTEIKIQRTTILPVVFYECGAWSLTLREELRLRVFENGVLRKIFGTKGDEARVECRRLHKRGTG